MSSCCRILFAHKNLANYALQNPIYSHKLGSNLSNLRPNFGHIRVIHRYPYQLFGLSPQISTPRRDIPVAESPTLSLRFRVIGRDISGIRSVASDVKRCSSSTASPRVKDKKLERIYNPASADVKPAIAKRIENGKENAGREQTRGVEGDISETVGPQIRVYSRKGQTESDIEQHDVVKEEIKGEEGDKEEAVAPQVRVYSRKERMESDIEQQAWDLLANSVVKYCNIPVGTVAANDPNDKLPLNYDQVFIRDFVPSALAFLLKGDGDIVKNFLLHTLQLQSWEKTVDCYSPGQGLMPASFKSRTVTLDENTDATEEVLDPDFGESAIGRVAPVDSGLWWIILLRAYGKLTGDYALQERVDVQTGLKLILNLCLTDGFDMFPSLLVTDGSCMIDRRMGIHGHPLEIQALFYSALRCSREMLTVNDGSKNIIKAINNRLSALSFHIREYYWLDMKKINEIYRYKTEEYSMDATNKFNIYPDQIPHWLMNWIPEKGGFMIGNLQPAHMDFRFFTLGNLWSIISSLGAPKQNEAVLNLIDAKWDDLMGTMPMKICYPAIEGEEWRIITGSDPKNTPWSYHNGGSWPTLLWQLTLACLKMGRSDLAEKAAAMAEKKLAMDHWPEYYDTRHGKFIGKQSRLYQTWTISGFLTSKMLLENPDLASLLYWEEDYELLEVCVCALTKKNGRTKCSRGAAKSHINLQ